ncbi:hypothetical protein E0M25_24520 [Bacillus mycoides]|uniref:hypothetical protein n=1 Tax=Bacillus mycoides TaxID=1405 RepID=UPI00103E1D34|nr:hypothetical protein [Bacillus mycoides]TBX72054.1 hypothetical protein E0M25_24520 [Bacillus mycoides]
MKKLKGINLHFTWEGDEDLSNRMENYVQSLNIEKEIDVYMEVLEGASENEVGWALFSERNIYIRPTRNLEEFELRLAHEITHIALSDEGYRVIACIQDDGLCLAFGNILHHLVLYPRLIASGFSLKQDTNIVMKELTNKLKDYKEISIRHGSDGIAYVLLLLINDLVRLQSLKLGEYLLEAHRHVPDLVQKAQRILEKIGERNSSITIEEYERYKIILEEELGLNFSFLQTQDSSFS